MYRSPPIVEKSLKCTQKSPKQVKINTGLHYKQLNVHADVSIQQAKFYASLNQVLFTV